MKQEKDSLGISLGDEQFLKSHLSSKAPEPPDLLAEVDLEIWFVLVECVEWVGLKEKFFNPLLLTKSVGLELKFSKTAGKPLIYLIWEYWEEFFFLKINLLSQGEHEEDTP